MVVGTYSYDRTAGAKVQRLSESEVTELLDGPLQDWKLDEGKLYREFEFEDFAQAFAFMTNVAALAEEQGHHPEWSNVYNVVKVHLTTHDANGLSARDEKLARAMDRASADVK